MLNVAKLKEIAKNRVKKKIETEEDLIELLRIWWSNKYSKPDNHPLFLAKTLEEHIIDYFTDKFMNDPKSINEVTEAQMAAEEERLKKVMGDQYHEEYDYLVPPSASELKGAVVKDEHPDIIEEDFTEVNTIADQVR